MAKNGKEPMGNEGIWDQVVSRSLQNAKNTSTSASVTHAGLAISVKPDRIYKPAVERELGKIDQNLRQTFRDAIQGLVKWPLFVGGAPGMGKSCATLCLADHVPGAFWTPWEAFWKFISDVNFGRAQSEIPGRLVDEGLGTYRTLSVTVNWTYKRWWAHFYHLPLAIIDDVGLRASANDTQYEALKQALDARERKPLIVTSNLDLGALGKTFDARVLDRLSCGTIVLLNGKSRR